MLMAVMLAALMSSLTSTFNSGATLFTLGKTTALIRLYDKARYLREDAQERLSS